MSVVRRGSPRVVAEGSSLAKRSMSESYAVQFTPSPDDWRLRGACVGMDPDAFIAGSVEHLPAMLEARSACLWCPVFKECSMSANTDDRIWALKAGRIPDEQATKAPGRPIKEPKEAPVDVVPRCPHGFVLMPSGRGRGCAECFREYDRERKVRKNFCKNGHRFTPENTINCVRTSGLPTRRCKTCQDDQAAKQRVRKTHCNKGHEFTEETTYVSPKGERRCRTRIKASDNNRKMKVA